MPHIIIEHSADFSLDSIIDLQKEIQNIMASITEGNFDANQCKARSFLFNEYLVGDVNQENSSFIHITVKILAGRSLEVRKKLSEKIMEFTKKFHEKLLFSPSQKDQLIETAHQIADVVSGVPHPQFPMQNSDLANKRCDLSVDIVEMDKETYQKFRVGN
jgi:5-carboxymethyl-2-hydroxymuconate isomerase